jgi:diacylglycerol kinase (ATP)
MLRQCASDAKVGTAAPARLAVLSNGDSRGNRGGRWARLPLDGLGGPSILTRDVGELPAALDAILEAHPDALAVNGGDGTLQTLLAECARRGVLDELPPIAVLPGGTTNMCAHDLSGVGNLRRAVRAYAALQELPRVGWPVVRRPILAIQTGDGPTAGTFVGLGAVVRGVEYWQDTLRRRARGGDLGVALAVTRSLWGLARRRPPFDRPTPVGLAFDGGSPAHTEVSALMVTSLGRLPIGMRPYWGDHRGPLASTWMDARPRRPLRYLPPLLWGRVRGLPDDAGYHSLRATSAVLDVDETWLLDGELQHAPGPLVITVGGPLAFLDLRRRRA